MASIAEKMMQDPQTLSIAYGRPELSLKTAGVAIAGFILSDRSYVLSMKDVQKALGFDARSENRLYELLQSISRFVVIPPALIPALEDPVLLPITAPDGTELNIRTIPADLVLVLLETIDSAKKDGYLNVGQLKTAKAAGQLLAIFKKNNMNSLIDESCGFEFYKNMARTRVWQQLTNKYGYTGFYWIKALPDAYFELVFSIYGSDWKEAAEDPEQLALVVNDTIFSRLQNSDVKVVSAEKPKRNYKSNAKKYVHPVFEIHLNGLRQLATAAGNNRNIFMQLLNRTHPKNNAWPIKDADFNIGSKQTSLSGFNSILKKSISGQNR